MFNICNIHVCVFNPAPGISLLATPHLDQLPDGSKVGAVPALRRQISRRVDGRQQNVLTMAGQAPKMSRTGEMWPGIKWMVKVKWVVFNPRTIDQRWR